MASDSLPVDATLRERLDVWKAAPGGRGDVEGEVEAGGFVAWNLEVSRCKSYGLKALRHVSVLPLSEPFVPAPGYR